ncbi:MAG: 1-acyl-sn-glycerol-3-phosphate acyltransferase [Burkholderiaceae bacterium]|nr:MAG: 1-acyl-sn-glycerol-3-phosphate acyltransferase [Burkholderiaceae bacterium]
MRIIIKVLFFAVIIRPITLIVLGLNVRGKNKLPMNGPAVLAANHNSHLDTMVLMSLYPLSKINKVRPVAAADYFLSNRYLAWFSLHCIGIIPLDRSGNADKKDLFSACHQALDNGDILIVFPEGSRGDPEKLSKIKSGLFYLTKDHTNVPVIPVVMHGLGRALPRGEALFVPFNCDVIVGDPLPRALVSKDLVDNISTAFNTLSTEFLTRGADA